MGAWSNPSLLISIQFPHSLLSTSKSLTLKLISGLIDSNINDARKMTTEVSIVFLVLLEQETWLGQHLLRETCHETPSSGHLCLSGETSSSLVLVLDIFQESLWRMWMNSKRYHISILAGQAPQTIGFCWFIPRRTDGFMVDLVDLNIIGGPVLRLASRISWLVYPSHKVTFCRGLVWNVGKSPLNPLANHSFPHSTNAIWAYTSFSDRRKWECVRLLPSFLMYVSLLWLR